MKKKNFDLFYKDLEQLVSSYHSYEGWCDKVLNKYILPLIDLEDDYGAHVFIQSGDGAVLSCIIKGNYRTSNIPCNSIVSAYKRLGRKLTDEDLKELGI